MKLGQNKKQTYAQKILSNMLFAFAFLAVNYLDVLKRRNPLKLQRTEQYVFLVGPYNVFRPSSC